MDVTLSTTTTAMAADPVTSLYEIAYKLDSSQQFAGDEELFKTIIDLSKSNKQTKQLSSQFFSKYFKRFPSTQEKVIDSLIDLIEEDDIPVRVSALKAIPSICTDNPEYIAKLVDILGQLLNTDSPIEYESTKNSIIELYKLNSANTLNSILLSLETDNQREFMLKFIKERLMSLIRLEYKQSTMEAQSFFRERILKLIGSSKDGEIEILVELFNCFPKYMLKDAIVFCDTLLSLIHKLPVVETKKKVYFILDMLVKKSTQNNNEPVGSGIFEFYKTKIFPSLNDMLEADQTDFITKFALITQSANTNDAPELFEIVFKLLKDKIPVPAPIDYDFKLTILEALLLSFSNLGAKSPAQMRRLCAYKTNTGQPSDMATDLDPSKFDDFVARLRVLNDRIGTTDAKLKKAIEVLPKSDTEQLAQLIKSQKTTSNLIQFIRNLSKNPPILNNSAIRPSFAKEQNPMKQFKKQYQPNYQHQQVGGGQKQQKQKNQVGQKQQQQSQQGQQETQGQSKNRYQPYVPPNLRRSNDNNKQQRGGGQGQQQKSGGDEPRVQLEFFTEKSKTKQPSPSSFKGRGSKSF
ncbi:hypothetical protein DFA_09966 [Cavenderia fasciculata]|uniref:Apoptosis inhibitor 5 n=1 Tax=Cavenderia fasciculata TaxID=261658 RepID=F4Q8X3_CACFS|nr:uncharacterized protein DFA_09966 [Cavenderia fasciculata]EGG15142.1 hypothetical protein DFA_09966 [Cavenderia fasciculata]|eukprot:XP_004351862.1 hypothetical protein DFA_09966 [Cavenderia fasciculata]